MNTLAAKVNKYPIGQYSPGYMCKKIERCIVLPGFYRALPMSRPCPVLVVMSDSDFVFNCKIEFPI
jgi:hypothetical protein